MKKGILLFLVLCGVVAVQAQESTTELSAQEAAAVAAILARENGAAAVKTTAEEDASADEEKIILPEETKREAFEAARPAPEIPEKDKVTAITEAVAEKPVTPPQEPLGAAVPDPAKPETAVAEEADAEEEVPAGKKQKCLTVAFVDIDEAFNAHPRTITVKEQIREKILSKEEEVQKAKELIVTLREENRQLAQQLAELKPFYERIVIEPHPLLPKIEESADSVELGNVLNRLTFARVEVLSQSPLNTPTELGEIKERISANKATIEEREIFIDTYKYTTREEILKLEQKEVKDILQDIYKEIKSFARKRNIAAVVRKDEILYGEQPVNVTKDFINRLKKSKKFRKRGK